MLCVSNLEAVYGGAIVAVRGVSLTVGDSELVALLGTNGAGKSTIARCITGLSHSMRLKVAKGDITVAGTSVVGLPAWKVVRHKVALVPEGRQLFPDLTVDDNLRLGAYTNPSPSAVREEMDRILGYFPILAKRKSQQAGYLSGGEQQMLALGRALMSHPQLLIMDEPSLGLAPKIAIQIFEIIRRINEERRMSILVIEQNASLALQYTDRAYIMENGRIMLSGSSAELLHDSMVKELYLGVSASGKERSYGEGRGRRAQQLAER